jgi:hypothetical protein
VEEDYNGAGGWQVTGGEGVVDGREATFFLCLGGGRRSVYFSCLYIFTF